MTPRIGGRRLPGPLGRRRDERGAMSVEWVLIVPMLLLIFALIMVYGRVGHVSGTLESGTRDGARSATLARSLGEARERARQAVELGLSGAPQSCRNSLEVQVVSSFAAGEPVTVNTRCTYSIADAGLPGAPGTLTAEASFTSMLDPYRGVE